MALSSLDPEIFKSSLNSLCHESPDIVMRKGEQSRTADKIRPGLCEHSVPRGLQDYFIRYG